MGSQEHLALVNAGRDAWNKWRTESPEERPYLTKFRFEGYDLSGYDLSGADFQGAHLVNAKLSKTRLRDADLRDTNLSGADLSEADLTGADLERADLSAANLAGASLTKANVTDCNFDDAYVEGTKFLGVKNLHYGVLQKLKSRWPLAGIPTRDLDYLVNIVESKTSESGFVDRPISYLEVEAKLEDLRTKLQEQFSLSMGDLRAEVLGEIKSLQDLDKRLGQLKMQISSVEERLPALGVSSRAHSFDQLVNIHRWGALRWLVVTIVLVVSTLAFATYDYRQAKYNYGSGSQESLASEPGVPTDKLESSTQFDIDVLPLIASKIIIYSLLSFAIIWSGRNYKAEMHNKAANQHRATALHTFEYVLQGSQSKETKERLLLLAAEAMYRDRATGYESSEKESSQVHSVFNEITRVIPRPPTSG